MCISNVVRKIKGVLANYRTNDNTTLKDIQTVVDAYISGDYSKAHTTKLYNANGAVYCEVLEVINLLLPNE